LSIQGEGQYIIKRISEGRVNDIHSFLTSISATTISIKTLHVCCDIKVALSLFCCYYKRDDFNFSLSSSNISTALAYGVYISQLLHYSRACAEYIDFLERAQMLRQKLLQRSKVGPKS
jgi:hypothetical protein